MSDVGQTPRCGKPVGSGIVSQPCALEKWHNGPCANRDVPASMHKRMAWLGEGNDERPQVVSKVAEPSEVVAALAQKPWDEVPAAIRQWAQGSAAMSALATLVIQVQAQGSVVVDEAYLRSHVPDHFLVLAGFALRREVSGG